jgi:hypothetical protein
MAYGSELWAEKKRELSRQALNGDRNLAVKNMMYLQTCPVSGTVSVKSSTTPRIHPASQRGAHVEMHAVQTDHCPTADGSSNNS